MICYAKGTLIRATTSVHIKIERTTLWHGTCRHTDRREDCARTFHRARSRSIYSEEREGIYFSLARINLRVQVNQFPDSRRDLLETGRVVMLFITFLPSQFPFAYRRELKVPLGRERERKKRDTFSQSRIQS